MPIVSKTSNRVIPANSRNIDVARATLNTLIPVHNRRTDAAFQVNGYTGVLYSYLTSGLPCACQAKGKAISARLNEDGKAPPEVINEMMTTSGTFGVRPYADRKVYTPAYAEQKASGKSMLEVDLSNYSAGLTPVPLSSLFDDEDIQGANRHTEGLSDRIDFTGQNDSASLEVEDDTSQDVSIGLSDFDTSLLGHSDVSCPVCFGSGYVGGYSIMHGYRKVFNFQDPSIELPAEAVIAVEKDVPSITTKTVAWTVVLPKGCIGIDAFRLWNDTVQLSLADFSIRVDNQLVRSEGDLIQYCDGLSHKIALQFNSESTFTHLELQVNQSAFSANFELPKLSKSSTQSLREATDPFTVLLSPRVPHVKAMDVIVESTFQKALQVKNVTGMNDKRFTTMGWSVEVRPVQPQELFFMLPRRRPVEQQNVRRPVISNPNPT